MTGAARGRDIVAAVRVACVAVLVLVSSGCGLVVDLAARDGGADGSSEFDAGPRRDAGGIDASVLDATHPTDATGPPDAIASPDADDGAVVLLDGWAADADVRRDGSVDLGPCEDWGNWICEGGGAMCHATCVGLELDCYGTACDCSLSGTLTTCPLPAGLDCEQCRNLLVSPCCRGL